MHILIISAMEEEKNAVENALKPFHKFENHFQLGSLHIKTQVSGIGNVQAGMKTIHHALCDKHYNLIIFTGIAGSLDPDQLPVYCVCCVTSGYRYDIDCTAFGYPLGCLPGKKDPLLQACPKGTDLFQQFVSATQTEIPLVTTACADSFLTDPHRALKNFPQCSITEMEFDGFTHACNHLKIPSIMIRGISDVVTQQGENAGEFEKNITQSCKKSADVTHQFLHFINDRQMDCL